MVNSNTLKEFVGNYGIKKKKIVLIQNGVDFDEIKTSPELQEELKKSLDRFNETPLLICEMKTI